MGKKGWYPPLTGQRVQHVADVPADADGLALDLAGAGGLAAVDAGIGGLRVLEGHLPEGVFDDDRGVMFIAHPFCFAIASA